MIQFKHRLLATLLVVLLPLANIASAASYSSASRAPSRSMKSGFSSQKNQPARSNTYTNNSSNQSGNTSFGSFGQQPNKAMNRSDSALNKDLEKNQAQQQALKNMDARTQQKTPMQAAQQTSVTGKPLDTVHANPQPPLPLPSPSPMSQAATAPTIIVQREGSSMGGAFMGFMLGQALSRPHSAPSPSYDTRRNDLEPIDGAADARYGNSNLGDAGNGTLAAAKAKPVETESAGWSMLRFLLWATFLSATGWIAYKIYRLFTPRKQAISHYSLGKV